jgi:hypothetical protein
MLPVHLFIFETFYAWLVARTVYSVPVHAHLTVKGCAR